MENSELTPEKSFELINQVLNEARAKIEGNGSIYAFWGLLSSIAAFSQYYLLKTGNFDINYYPYFLMPLGAIYTGFYFYKKRRKTQNHIGRILAFSWWTIIINVFALSFLFPGILKAQLIPILLILLGIGTIVSAGVSKNSLILISGILLNIAGIAGFHIEWQYQSLLLGIVSAVAIFIPGVILMVEHKRKQHV